MERVGHGTFTFVHACVVTVCAGMQNKSVQVCVAHEKTGHFSSGIILVPLVCCCGLLHGVLSAILRALKLYSTVMLEQYSVQRCA